MYLKDSISEIDDIGDKRSAILSIDQCISIEIATLEDILRHTHTFEITDSQHLSLVITGDKCKMV